MPYKDEFLKKLKELRDFKAVWESDLEKALKFKPVLASKETAYQLGRFMRLLNNSSKVYFGSKENYDAFIAKHADLFPKRRFPNILSHQETGKITIEEGDFEKILDALDEEFKDRPEVLENLYFDECNPDLHQVNHPMSELVDSIKADVDKLYEGEETKKELKDALDYANEELVEKLGPNLVDNAIDAVSNKRALMAHNDFDAFVEKNGLDASKVKNYSTLPTVVSPNFDKYRQNFEAFKPFLDMGLTFDQDYKDKLFQLDELCRQEGLLTHAMGGESGYKEYGLSDYFQKNYALKKALVDYGKISDDEQKKEALSHIKALTEDVKTVTGKYEKVLDFIEKNFDLENIALPGNVYSGRPVSVPDGDLGQWKPNLPAKFDFEKSPAVVFLSGFTQLKSVCQVEEVTLEQFIEDPVNTYIAGIKKYSDADDRKIYLPRSEENTLGKRMAHVFYHSTMDYGEIQGIAMMGGRGMEFLYNTSPSDDKSIDNAIKAGIIKDYSKQYNHSPEVYFGHIMHPNVGKIKNIFAIGDEIDNLSQASPDYVSEEGKIDPAVKSYSAAIKTHGNTPIDQEYRRVIKTLTDCFEEQEVMGNHLDQYLKSPNDYMTHISNGALIAAGRQYFVDYLHENNLSLASIEDENLRQEIFDFVADPVTTINQRHYHFPENGVESLDEVKGNFNKAWREFGKKDSAAFMEKFNQNNQKPRGYNAGKDIPTILNDNRGGWWERWRGTTSKQYQDLVKATQNSLDPQSPTHGDKEAMYACAKAYRAYKLPEGRRFSSLSKTAKKRIEFCDSIINAYEQEKAAREAANNPAPANNINNNIINQNDFQKQLQNDLGPKEVKAPKNEEIKEEAVEKDPPVDSVAV